MAASISILNGPNLNLLGTREPEIYGSVTLEAIAQSCQEKAKAHGLVLDFRQSNHEGELVDWVQQAACEHDGLIINAGAYTHTSVALYDALRMMRGPSIELHISNLYRREAFRHHSMLAPAVTAVMAGFGASGYVLAIDAINTMIGER